MGVKESEWQRTKDMSTKGVFPENFTQRLWDPVPACPCHPMPTPHAWRPEPLASGPQTRHVPEIWPTSCPVLMPLLDFQPPSWSPAEFWDWFAKSCITLTYPLIVKMHESHTDGWLIDWSINRLIGLLVGVSGLSCCLLLSVFPDRHIFVFVYGWIVTVLSQTCW